MDYEVQRCTRRCATTGRELAPGEWIYSALLVTGGHVARQDYCQQAWSGPPEGALGWWKSHLPTRESSRRHWAPNDLLLELLEELAERPDQLELRFMLSLLLVRRRVLRPEGTERDELGREVSVLECPRRETTYRVVTASPTPERAAELNRVLAELLSGGAPPPPPADAVAADPPAGAERVPAESGPPAPRGPRGLAIFAAVLLAVSGGANCQSLVHRYTDPLPRALPENASLNQIIDVVNANSAKVQSIYSSRATLSTPGYPSLRANVAFARNRSFRLRGDTALSGQEVDLGSNEELFWLWIKRQQPPALYLARHDQFAASRARQVLPIEADWLPQALGLVSFAADDKIAGPFPGLGGKVSLRSTHGLGADETTRVTVIDGVHGLPLEQHVYDRAGQRIASALLSRHVRDPASGAYLPQHVEIQWPPARLELKLDLADVQVNRLDPARRDLFTKPTIPGYNEINLADPNLPLGPPAAATAARTAWRPAVPAPRAF